MWDVMLCSSPASSYTALLLDHILGNVTTDLSIRTSALEIYGLCLKGCIPPSSETQIQAFLNDTLQVSQSSPVQSSAV